MGSENVSKGQLWTGRVLSGLVTLFLLFDGVLKFFLDKMPPEAQAEGAKLGYPPEVMPYLGTVLIVSTLLYAFPRTAVLGATLLTGYLGGAVATHVRVLNPLGSHILFPTYLGIILWAGLYLRFPKLREVTPWQK
ncbi:MULTISPECIES: DoxX family protein [Leptospira]|uniref:DoxX family protein n=1 Tax=Leptospira andrefontaineae TaxID=2484976 RepID=A0A4R9H6H0_9LEPT|nr:MULTISPECIES: DoxX family protein [Leptospira]TGK41191.1 DoxX family protein [Leptospira andrefontaineae]